MELGTGQSVIKQREDVSVDGVCVHGAGAVIRAEAQQQPESPSMDGPHHILIEQNTKQPFKMMLCYL